MTASIYRGLKAVEAYGWTASSIEVYEIQFFRVDFTQIGEYVFRSSFLTTLNIYKDYFEGRQRLHSCTSVKQSFVHANCDRRQNFP